MGLKTHGTMAVDWEQRIDYDRLRKERLRGRSETAGQSPRWARFCFDMNNVR